jgi:hypothetical protein
VFLRSSAPPRYYERKGRLLCLAPRSRKEVAANNQRYFFKGS